MENVFRSDLTVFEFFVETIRESGEFKEADKNCV